MKKLITITSLACVMLISKQVFAVVAAILLFPVGLMYPPAAVIMILFPAAGVTVSIKQINKYEATGQQALAARAQMRKEVFMGLLSANDKSVQISPITIDESQRILKSNEFSDKDLEDYNKWLPVINASLNRFLFTIDGDNQLTEDIKASREYLEETGVPSNVLHVHAKRGEFALAELL